MKIDIEDVKFSMQEKGIDQKKIQEVIKNLEEQIEQEKLEKERNPRPKKIKYIVAAQCPAGTRVTEYPMVVVEAEESVSPDDILTLIKSSAMKANNEVKKLRKKPIVKLFEAFECCPKRFLTENKVSVVTKEPTQIILASSEELEFSEIKANNESEQ